MRKRPLAVTRGVPHPSIALPAAGSHALASGRAAPRSRDPATKGRRWFWVSLLSQVLAASFAFVGVLWPGDALANVIGPCAAVAAAATAWGQLGRHDELSKSYALAYQELISIQTLAETVTTEEDLDRVVADGEGAISREHTMWMAKRLDSAGQLSRA